MGSEIADRKSMESAGFAVSSRYPLTIGKAWLVHLLPCAFCFGEPIKPHPDAAPNTHPPGEVDIPANEKWIVPDPGTLPGIVLDETDAVLKGAWQYSTHTPPYVGIGYLHDQKSGKGEKTVTWSLHIPKPGWYEVRISHCYNVRRSTRALVVIHHAKGKTRKRINQQEKPEHNSLFRSLGIYFFEKGNSGTIVVSNEGSEPNKVVIADAIQLLSVPSREAVEKSTERRSNRKLEN